MRIGLEKTFFLGATLKRTAKQFFCLDIYVILPFIAIDPLLCFEVS